MKGPLMVGLAGFSCLFLLLLLASVTCAGAAATAYPPVVLMHGLIGDAGKLAFMQSLIEKNLPGVYVKNVDLGGSYASLFRGIKEQVAEFCFELAHDDKLNAAPGINIVGTSQGGIIARAYLEQCNNPPVLNFISWVSPQGGQFGVPGLGNATWGAIIERVAECCIYDPWVQKSLSLAGYWRDPYRNQLFINNSALLADIDNLRTQKHEIYRQRVLSVKNFVISYSEVDEIVRPQMSGWFAHFAPNTTTKLVPLEQQDLYTQDWIGLKTLDQSGRLHRFVTQCPHRDYSSETCFVPAFMKNVMPFLAIPAE